MASSISSSEEIGRDTSRYALPSGLRLTAADRPGIAQPVPERDIPDQPWRAMALIVMVLVILLTSLWEWRMRTLARPSQNKGSNRRFMPVNDGQTGFQFIHAIMLAPSAAARRPSRRAAARP
jgi:hypothetical protein